MKKAILAALALFGASVPACAQSISADDLNRRTIERRAVEAVIWGIPAVNADLMRQQMLTKTAGKVGQVIYWGRPLDSRNQTLTPNPDALYFMTFFDTKDGPVVLDLPSGDADGSFNGNIVRSGRCRWRMQACSGSTRAKEDASCSCRRGTRGRRPRAITCCAP